MMCRVCVVCVPSISALQWLCNADKCYHNPPRRLLKFFSTLYASMVCMHYSENNFPSSSGRRCFENAVIGSLFSFLLSCLYLVCYAANVVCKYCTGLVVDFPNSTKAKNLVPYFAVLAYAMMLCSCRL